MDITYIPMGHGFVYLAALVDWFSRRVVARKWSVTLETEFRIDAVNEALARQCKTEIFNSDQGSRFTSVAFTRLLQEQKLAISVDARGAWRNHVFVERLWRSVPYEEGYTRAHDNVSDAREPLGRYPNSHNSRRPRSTLRAGCQSGPIPTSCRRRWQNEEAGDAVASLRSG